VYDEMRQAMHASIGHHLEPAGARFERDLPASPKTTGQPIVFRNSTPTGRLQLVPASVIPAAEKPSAEFPFVLITGRQLEHWHTGSMTRRSSVLDHQPIIPHPCTVTAGAAGCAPGALVGIRSRRMLQVRGADSTPRGTVFMPFAYGAAANLLTTRFRSVWQDSRV
jgi:formate dehydrogenase major subunit